MLKSNAKKDASRMAKEAPTRGADDHLHLGFWAWEGGRGKGKPFPEGLKADSHALNHLSPEGWWDSREVEGGEVARWRWAVHLRGEVVDYLLTSRWSTENSGKKK